MKDESVEDTLVDLGNYCLLFAAFLRWRKATAPSRDTADLAEKLLIEIRHLVLPGDRSELLLDLKKFFDTHLAA